MHGHTGSIIRRFDVDTHFRRGDRTCIVTDAAPWGLGGVLVINDQPVEYFSDGVCDNDRTVLSLHDAEPSACQQALEALAMLVALRV